MKITKLPSVLCMLICVGMFLSKEMYLHALINLYILYSMSLNLADFTKVFEKKRCWIVILWEVVEIVAGITLSILTYRYENIVLFVLVLFVMIFGEIRVLLRIAKKYNSRNTEKQ